jgi:hypothetical protein
MRRTSGNVADCTLRQGRRNGGSQSLDSFLSCALWLVNAYGVDEKPTHLLSAGLRLNVPAPPGSTGDALDLAEGRVIRTWLFYSGLVGGFEFCCC